jgi:hypothetical protein
VRRELGWLGGDKYLFLAATHTHSGPDTEGLWGRFPGVSGVDAAYHRRLIETIARLVKDTASRLSEAKLSAASRNIDPRGLCRDIRDPVVIDPELDALQFRGADGKTLGTLVRWSCHPEVMERQNREMTPDFPGALCARVEEKTGGPCVYLSGVIGGMMTPDVDHARGSAHEFEEIRRIGTSVADLALDALKGAPPSSAGAVSFQSRIVTLPVENSRYLLFLKNLVFGHRLFDVEGKPLGRWSPYTLALRHLLFYPLPDRLAPRVETEVSRIDIGPVRVLGVPGELFPELAIGGYDGRDRFGHPLVNPTNPNPPALVKAPKGPYLRELVGAKVGLIVGLANDHIGYIIPEYDFQVTRNRSMEPHPPGTHYEETNSIGPSAAPLLMKAARELLEAKPQKAASFRRRGVLEGFYGKPWTWDRRARMIDWIAAHGGNLFVIAPKDEPLQRRNWREPLPPSYLAELGKLRASSAAKGVDLAWTLSPLGLRPGRASELAAALAKYRQVLAAGVKELAIAFDDTEPNPRQIDFANAVFADLSRDHPGLEMTFVPAVYWSQAAPSPYLDRVASRLDSRFLVAWTGPKIIPERISADDGRAFRAYIRHRLVLGDNFPVQDRLVDSGPLQLGPLLGRDPGLVDSQDAFVSNASPLAEASKLPLATALDFARDPGGYDPETSWRRAIGTGALASLARECASSWLSPSPRWLDGTTAVLIRRYRAGGKPAELQARLLQLKKLPSDLKAVLSSRPELYAELEPWARKLASLAAAGLPGGSPVKDALENPASVSDLALDRFLFGGEPDSPRDILQAFDKNPARARAALGTMGALADLLPITADHGWKAGLLPMVHVIGMSARRALAYAEENGRPPFIPDQIWEWRMKMRMIPLLATRALLDNAFAAFERRWWGPPWTSEPRSGRLLPLWLFAERILHPKAFPVALAKALARRDEPEMTRLFSYLAGLPVEVRREAGPSWTPELEPWLLAVSEYGRLGLLSLSLDAEFRATGKVSEEGRRKWELQRRRLLSANGLEAAAKLKYTLDSFVAWRRTPPENRPKEFRVEWPADLGRLF